MDVTYVIQHCEHELMSSHLDSFKLTDTKEWLTLLPDPDIPKSLGVYLSALWAAVLKAVHQHHKLGC